MRVRRDAPMPAGDPKPAGIVMRSRPGGADSSLRVSSALSHLTNTGHVASQRACDVIEVSAMLNSVLVIVALGAAGVLIHFWWPRSGS
jgi:hypothetical protein